MNSKKAKALRKVIKNMTKDNQNVIQETVYTENEQNRKTMSIQDLENGEMVTKVIPIAAGTVTVKKNSKRGLYLHLKKSMEDHK